MLKITLYLTIKSSRELSKHFVLFSEDIGKGYETFNRLCKNNSFLRQIGTNEMIFLFISAAALNILGYQIDKSIAYPQLLILGTIPAYAALSLFSDYLAMKLAEMHQ